MSERIITALITAAGALIGAIIGNAITARATIEAAKINSKGEQKSPQSNQNKGNKPRQWLWIIAGAGIGAVLVLGILYIFQNFPPIPHPNNPTPTNAILTAIPTSDRIQLLHLDFEQPGAGLGFAKGGNWNSKVVDGNGLLEVNSPTTGGPAHLPVIVFGSEAWANYVFEYRFKITECDQSYFFGCMIMTEFRNESGQAYVLSINVQSGEVNLQFGALSGWVAIDKEVTDTYLDLSVGTWHNVLLTVDRDAITVLVDNKQTTALSDNRLRTGAVSIEVGAGTTAQFDDISAQVIP